MIEKKLIGWESQKGNWLLVILSLYTCTYFVYRDLGISNILGWFFSIFLVCFVFITRSQWKIKLTINKKTWLVLIGFIAVSFLRPSSRRDGDEVFYVVAIASATLYVLLCNASYSEIKLCRKFYKTISFILGSLILFFRVFPSIYWKTIYRFLAASPRQLAAYYVPRGYGIPVGGSLTLADYIMMLALITTFNEIVSGVAKKEKIKNAVLVLFYLLAILAEGRRGELLACVFAMFFIFMISRSKKDFMLKAGIILLVLLILYLSFNALLAAFGDNELLYRYTASIQGAEKGQDVTSGRSALWKEAIRLFRENPIFGVGFGGFANSISSSFRAIHGEDVMDVHNCFLQFLCETGIVGTVIMTSALIVIFVNTLRTISKNKRNEINNKVSNEIVKIGQTSIGIQTFLLFVCMLDPAFYKPIFWAFYGIAVILSDYAQSMSKSNNALLSKINEF